MIEKKPLQVKGVAVKSLLEFMDAHYPDIFTQWIQRLDPEVQELYNKGVLVSRWYDADKYLRQPGLRAAKLLFMTPQEFGWESGSYSSHSALHGVYRFFLKFGGPAMLIKRVPFFLQTYYRPANVKILFIDEKKGQAKLEFIDFVPHDDFILYRIMGWGYNTLIEAGASNVDLEIEKVYEPTTYVMSIVWE